MGDQPESSNFVSDEVFLEVEGSSLRCNKKELSVHSDYFKIMFGSNFVEKEKKVIKLEGVRLKPLNAILTLLWDERYFIPEEDLVLVLETACMLQFVKVINMCVDKIQAILSPKNCFPVWEACEALDLHSLCLKAKSMALTEFAVIKDLDCLLRLSLRHLFVYLANIYLQCENEMLVFQTCMKWWYENSEKYVDRDRTLFTLLACINFNSLSCHDIKEMQSYPDIADNENILGILNCIIDFKNQKILSYDENIINKAKVLNESRSRIYPEYPCFLVKKFANPPKGKKRGLMSGDELYLIHYDKYKRRRPYVVVDNQNMCDGLQVALCDSTSGNLHTFLPIEKCTNLYGYKLIGYKEFIFLFGGEFYIGNGNWNKNFFVYDNVREKWERKCLLPFVRRHFETCMCGDYLYVVGGTGEFRVLQENMFWYKYKEDLWSHRITLPCSGRQIKCCEFRKQLFLLSINSIYAYIFDHSTSNWITIEICDGDIFVPNFPDKFTLFSYNDRIYIKGSTLIEFKLDNQRLIFVRNIPVKYQDCDEMESVLCNDFVYTFYKSKVEDEELRSVNCMTLEKFCMKTHTVSYILENVAEDAELHFSNFAYTLKMPPKLFAFHHYRIVENDEFVTDHNYLE